MNNQGDIVVSWMSKRASHCNKPYLFVCVILYMCTAAFVFGVWYSDKMSLDCEFPVPNTWRDN